MAIFDFATADLPRHHDPITIDTVQVKRPLAEINGYQIHVIPCLP